MIPLAVSKSLNNLFFSFNNGEILDSVSRAAWSEIRWQITYQQSLKSIKTQQQ